MTLARLKTLLLSAVAVALVLAASPARAADVDGKWTGSLDTPMGAVPINFAFKTDGVMLSGSMIGPDGGEIPIKNGKIDGDRISFVVTVDFGGMPIDFSYTGVVGPDALKMSSDFMGMPFEFTLMKAKE